MKALLLLLLACFTLTTAQAQTPPAPATGDELPAAVTEDEIAVTSDFRGFSVTVFGFNPDRRGRGDVVVAVRGPMMPARVMRKTRVFGFWVNGPPVEFSRAPSFHSVISERPLRSIASTQEIWRLQLDPAASAQLAGDLPDDADPSAYRAALVRLRSAQGLYSVNPRGLQLISQRRLFTAQVRIPANAPIGDYVADVYLFRDRRLVSSQRSRVVVSRVGIERTIHDLSTTQPLLYGFAAIAMALSAGAIAAYAFRRA